MQARSVARSRGWQTDGAIPEEGENFRVDFHMRGGAR